MPLSDPIIIDELDIEVPVTIQDKEYVLREAPGKLSTQFINAKAATYVVNSEGAIVGFKNLANLMPMLVGGCLFEKGSDKPVGERFVEDKLSHRLKERLFNRALDISRLRETDGTLAKLFQELFSLPGVTTSVEELMTAIENHPEGDVKFGAVRALFRADEEDESGKS